MSAADPVPANDAGRDPLAPRGPTANPPAAGAARRSIDVVLFCLLLGVAATFLGGYMYGESNQVEHLPMIFRAMDPGYLTGDFYVNAVDGFNPRFYYVWLMAAASRWVPTPLLFVVLTCLANAAIAGVTWRITRRVAPESDLAPALACCTVLAVNAFNEGAAAQIPRNFLGPSLLARPIAMLGLWWTLEREAVRPALLFVAATVLHPLVGAETAAVALAAAALALVADTSTGTPLRSRLIGADAGRLAVVGLVVAGAAAFLYGEAQAQTLSAERFIHILAEARGPHHYIPSRFGAGSHLAFAIFCLAAGISWWQWRRACTPPRSVSRRAPSDQRLADGTLAAVVVVLVACLGGYVFVELWPTRLWTAAQPFRMTYLIKWLGLVLLARSAALAVRPENPTAERASGALLALGVGRFQPAIALMGHLGVAASRWFGPARARFANAVVCGFALIAVAAVVVPVTSRPEEPFLLAALLAIAGCFLFIGSSLWRRLLPTAAVAAAVLVLIVFRASPTLMAATRVVGVTAPRMSLAESNKAWSDAARFARAETPQDALFVLPPRVGGFRLISARAAVVDNKVFPFGDADMEEWYARMRFTHAGSDEGELPNLMILDANYLTIGDEHLREVAARYGATHALLWPPTETEMPVLYEDAAFKIVRIEPR